MFQSIKNIFGDSSKPPKYIETFRVPQYEGKYSSWKLAHDVCGKGSVGDLKLIAKRQKDNTYNLILWSNWRGIKDNDVIKYALTYREAHKALERFENAAISRLDHIERIGDQLRKKAGRKHYLKRVPKKK